MKSKKLQGALAKLNSKEKASTSLDFQKISTTEALQVVGGKGGGQSLVIQDCNAWGGSCGTWGGSCGTWS